MGTIAMPVRQIEHFVCVRSGTARTMSAAANDANRQKALVHIHPQFRTPRVFPIELIYNFKSVKRLVLSILF